jgi:hypothetical protein
MTPHYEQVQDLCRQIFERHSLSSRHATNDPAYHELVALGTEGIPAILKHIDEYKQGRLDYEFAIWEPLLALYAITGSEPEPAHGVVVEGGFVKSHLPTLVDTWLEWGRKEGHTWDD